MSGPLSEGAGNALGRAIGSQAGSIVANTIVGGSISAATGGKFANGASYSALVSVVSTGVGAATKPNSAPQNAATKNQSAPSAVTQSSAQSSATSKALSVIADIAGKIWTLPNTIVGAAYGLLGHVVGEVAAALNLRSVRPRIQFGNNAIEFLDNPLTFNNTAITIGNTISYGRGVSPAQFGAYGDSSVNVGLHEKAHTFQYQTLGPLFIPTYLIGGALSKGAGNPFENAAQNYGRGTGGWWP